MSDSPLPRTADRRHSSQISVVLSPEQLAQYSKVDTSLPTLVVQARADELHREFVYAVVSLIAGVIAFLSIVGGYVFLVLHGFPKSAAGLLATGVLSLIGGFIRNRLGSGS